jgi:glucose-1-phosphate thymidylyltransferase
MKGIILAGGTGSRLYPATLAASKQLLPVFDKPMIYYPLSTLMQAHIRDILIITTPVDLARFTALLKDGSQIGINITYAVQEQPRGLAEAFIIGKSFIGNDSVAMILGDNIFYGYRLCSLLQRYNTLSKGAAIFGYHVQFPHRYGVAEFDAEFRVVHIEEKPKTPKSHYAVCGLYFYDSEVASIAESLTPSARHELEITDINNIYLQKQLLHIELLGQGYAWLDTGTFQALQQASCFVQTIQERQGIKIACIEEIALRQGWIDVSMFEQLVQAYGGNAYGLYLQQVLNNQKFSKDVVFS